MRRNGNGAIQSYPGPQKTAHMRAHQEKRLMMSTRTFRGLLLLRQRFFVFSILVDKTTVTARQPAATVQQRSAPHAINDPDAGGRQVRVGPSTIDCSKDASCITFYRNLPPQRICRRDSVRHDKQPTKDSFSTMCGSGRLSYLCPDGGSLGDMRWFNQTVDNFQPGESRLTPSPPFPRRTSRTTGKAR
jgi:hypothetical protein